MKMRLRLPELLKEKEVTAYWVAENSDDRISMSTIYRLKRAKGRVKLFDAELLEALCDVLKCEPSELLQREPNRRGKK